MAAEAPGQAIPATAGAALETELVATFGEAQRERIHRGIAQTAALWKRSDGDVEGWASFVRQNFAGTPAAVDALFNRFQHNLEMIWGHTQEIRRELNSPADLDTGPVAPSTRPSRPGILPPMCSTTYSTTSWRSSRC